MDVSKFNLFGVLFNFKDKKARDDHAALAETVSSHGTDIAGLKVPAFSEPEENADVRTAVGNVTGNKPLGTLFTNIKAALNGLITLGEMRNYLVNNGTVTETGKYFLDAAYGKTLLDQITALNSNMQIKYVELSGSYTLFSSALTNVIVTNPDLDETKIVGVVQIRAFQDANGSGGSYARAIYGWVIIENGLNVLAYSETPSIPTYVNATVAVRE